MRTVLLAVGLIVVVCWGRSFGDVQPDLNENRKRKNVAVINRDSLTHSLTHITRRAP